MLLPLARRIGERVTASRRTRTVVQEKASVILTLILPLLTAFLDPKTDFEMSEDFLHLR